MMKEVVINEHGPPEVLRIKERPIPEPKPGWVLVKLTAYSGAAEDFIATPVQELIDEIEADRFREPIGSVYALKVIVAAHRLMKENTAGGKIVVVT